MKYIFIILLSFYVSQLNSAMLLRSQKLSKWGVLPANYSGITSFGNGTYAIVSDKEPLDGFYVWNIQQDRQTGQICYVENKGFRGQMPLDVNSKGISLRDEEDIIYCPQRNSFFICGEGYQDIIELDREGQRTGYELEIPSYLCSIYPNYGFEALAYDSLLQTFFVTTENVLPSDGLPSSHLNHSPISLHLQTFQPSGNDDSGKILFSPSDAYEYVLDPPLAKRPCRSFRHGVVAMTSLGNGELVILEREAYVSHTYLGSWVSNKLYLVDTKLEKNGKLSKHLVSKWTTRLKMFAKSWANYEGMCLGQPLIDGTKTLLFVSDSQCGYGFGTYHLEDYIRVVVL